MKEWLYYMINFKNTLETLQEYYSLLYQLESQSCSAKKLRALIDKLRAIHSSTSSGYRHI